MKLKTALLGAAASLILAPAAFAERGTDGEVRILYAQAVSTMNAYLSSGTKDVEVGSLVLEPLAGFNEKGEVIPRLVTEIPSLENGGISEDLKSITWKIIPGLKWSDGTPFTAHDAVFTANYCMDPAGGCAQLARYEGVDKVEALDDLTVKVSFHEPKPNPFMAFVGATSPILQAAQFANCTGANASTCTEENFKPIGTGPFRVTEFRTNDTVMLEANPNYRDPAKPAFATALVKGGGDATAAARAVMETGEFDYAWNTQISPELQEELAGAGKGQFVNAFGTLVERIEMNMTDPSPNLPEGERSTAAHPHPILSDIRVRKALSMAIDRQILVDIGYGEAGRPTCNLVPAPELYASDNTDCLTQDMEGAKALLAEAGWTDTDGDGILDKDGEKLSLVYQTSVNAIRQDFQAIIKQWWNELGVEVELKTVDPSVFFGGDAGSPDTFQKFYADVEMYANNFDGTDPEPYLAQYTCDKAPKPESQWQGENINRFCDPEYDALIKQLTATGDMEERSALAKRLNDMLTKDSYVIVPIVDRGRLSAHSNTLGGVVLNTWDSEIWNASDWFRIK
ncbi:peptide/nickel transport system substrate-binding protein [Rhodobacter aestuarii]|uniref:Peptide/nickel transport system substrate-binding protein n=1 Tax=Rhodobacter aestuarii TaxID=453582 RepID=A0A1N7N999_9RHOB|nr:MULTISPECIES: peptide ABC transporter substrate-binding protein [Rhodobacter]PTV96316.1 peptide/nickel transport system substrate-binding protein [Rhodobacter aestuarii]SIS94934.1 peptide/nickel transport system substrate-binding protein [Rhodobacter aestuarii]SOB92942.1 peptide/nickel transport system substrate-binding protein [Rhodobacter sp. JA431]